MKGDKKMSVKAEYFTQTELALAAYSNLTAGMFGKDYADALQGGGNGISATQATEFASKWSDLAQYIVASGVSATVFEVNSRGRVIQ